MPQAGNRALNRLKSCIQWATDRVGQENFAVMLMLSSTTLFPLAFLYPSQHNMPALQTNLARGFSITVTHIVIGHIFGIDMTLSSWHDLKYCLFRNGIMTFHQLLYTWMYFVVPYPIINAIFVSAPLFVFPVDYYVNGVTISRSQKWGVALGLIGVLTTINADLILSLIIPSYNPTSEYKHYITDSISVKVALSLLTLASNIPWAFAIVSQKRIQHVPGMVISYVLGLLCLFSSGVAYSTGTIPPTTPQPAQFIWACLCCGLVLCFCQINFMSALNLTKNSGKLTMCMFMYPVSSFTVSVLVNGQPLNILAVGGILLMAYGLFKVLFPSKQQDK